MRSQFARTFRAVLLSLSGATILPAYARGAPDATVPSASAASEAPQPASIAPRFAIEKYKLANGLTVILHEDHSAPVLSYQTWFRVGSNYDPPGYSGMAHLFEHMMFRGAKRYGLGQFEKLLQANGGRHNAGTTHDFTYYYETVPAGKLDLVMDLDSDRMANLQITPENLTAEREVVKEERRETVDNNPVGMLREAVFANVFRVSPYRVPIIGYMKDIDAITVDKAKEFYRTYYAPNNAVIVVAGDFKSAEAKALIEKRYGAMPAQEIPKRTFPSEPKQSAARMQALEKNVESATFSLAYQAARDGAPDAYALDLLSYVLGAGNSSRLHRRLVYKDQMATSVAAHSYTLQRAGVLQTLVSLKPNGNVAKAERAVQGEIWRMRNRLVAPEELEAAKKPRAAHVRRRLENGSRPRRSARLRRSRQRRLRRGVPHLGQILVRHRGIRVQSRARISGSCSNSFCCFAARQIGGARG